jgi:hypothetical protein
MDLGSPLPLLVTQIAYTSIAIRLFALAHERLDRLYRFRELPKTGTKNASMYAMTSF